MCARTLVCMRSTAPPNSSARGVSSITIGSALPCTGVGMWAGLSEVQGDEGTARLDLGFAVQRCMEAWRRADRPVAAGCSTVPCDTAVHSSHPCPLQSPSNTSTAAPLTGFQTARNWSKPKLGWAYFAGEGRKVSAD